MEFDALVEGASHISRSAGRLIYDMSQLSEKPTHRIKKDLSPVTEADIAANELITNQLKVLAPHIPIVAEESVAIGQIPDVTTGVFWLVDPLDGTKEFISGRNEYTVNIALIKGGTPVIGVIYLPALTTIYWGGQGIEAVRQFDGSAPERIRTRDMPEEGATVVTSRSHLTPETESWLSTITTSHREYAGSSLKFCRVAEGLADLYPRFGTTMEWDIAAGHAIVEAAGGNVKTVNGKHLHYGKPSFKNPYFIVRGS